MRRSENELWNWLRWCKNKFGRDRELRFKHLGQHNYKAKHVKLKRFKYLRDSWEDRESWLSKLNSPICIFFFRWSVNCGLGVVSWWFPSVWKTGENTKTKSKTHKSFSSSRHVRTSVIFVIYPTKHTQTLSNFQFSIK